MISMERPLEPKAILPPSKLLQAFSSDWWRGRLGNGFKFFQVILYYLAELQVECKSLAVGTKRLTKEAIPHVLHITKLH
jgi:hypothetical protein